jgi:hypothetical protein
LISLKTAKSGDLRAQQYQGLSKTLDFAGETISFRFLVFSFRAKSKIRSWDSEGGSVGSLENLEKLPSSK